MGYFHYFNHSNPKKDFCGLPVFKEVLSRKETVDVQAKRKERRDQLKSAMLERAEKNGNEKMAVYEDAKESLGLDQEMISEILIATFEQVEETASHLKVELDKDKDLMALMEKANKALGHISAKIAKEGAVSSSQEDYPSFDSLNEHGQIVTHTLQAVAHEIRNPLLAVGGFAKKLSNTIDPDSKGGRYLNIILEEATRLENVLAEMTRGRV